MSHLTLCITTVAFHNTRLWGNLADDLCDLFQTVVTQWPIMTAHASQETPHPTISTMDTEQAMKLQYAFVNPDAFWSAVGKDAVDSLVKTNENLMVSGKY